MSDQSNRAKRARVNGDVEGEGVEEVRGVEGREGRDRGEREGRTEGGAYVAKGRASQSKVGGSRRQGRGVSMSSGEGKWGGGGEGERGRTGTQARQLGGDSRTLRPPPSLHPNSPRHPTPHGNPRALLRKPDGGPSQGKREGGWREEGSFSFPLRRDVAAGSI